MIVSRNCPHCRSTRMLLDMALRKLKVENELTVEEINSESEEAVNIAIDNGIMDIPGIALNGKSLYGTSITFEQILLFLRKNHG